MSQYIQGIIIDGVKTKIDYTGLANTPDLTSKQDKLTDTDNGYGQRIKNLENTLSQAINFSENSY